MNNELENYRITSCITLKCAQVKEKCIFTADEMENALHSGRMQGVQCCQMVISS